MISKRKTSFLPPAPFFLFEFFHENSDDNNCREMNNKTQKKNEVQEIETKKIYMKNHEMFFFQKN